MADYRQPSVHPFNPYHIQPNLHPNNQHHIQPNLPPNYRFHGPTESHQSYKLDNTNLWNEWNNIPQRYFALFKSTRRFISTVHQLYRLPGSFRQASLMLVEFSSGVLRAPGSCFSSMLNSQRTSIYAMLDTALLEILLHEWDDEERKDADDWAAHTQHLRHALSDHSLLFKQWAGEDMEDLVYPKLTESDFVSDGTWMAAIYFDRSRRFLKESMELYGLRNKINVFARGRLPVEVLDEVARLVSVEEGLPSESLSIRFASKGKGNHLNVIEGTKFWYYDDESEKREELGSRMIG